MPHTVPRRRFRSDDLPNTEEWNDNFLPLAQKLAGRIGEHDIASSIFAFANLATSCYYAGHQVTAEVDPDLTTNDWFTQGGGGPDAVHAFTDGYGWERVTSLLVEPSTGEDHLWIIAQFQHAAWRGLVGDFPTEAPGISTPMRLQYALRVDGVVVDETITGAAIVPDPPPQQMYRVDEGSSIGVGISEFDWRRIQYVQDTVGINNAAHATRIMAIVPVSPGDHDIEAIARRVPNLKGAIDASGEGVYAEVLNRRLFVVRLKGVSASTGDASTLNVAAFADGDVISDSSLGGRLSRLTAKLNDITDADLERGALNHNHLPSVITYPEVVNLNPGSSVPITTVYGGFGIDTGTEWTTVNDGAGGNARTSTAMDFATYTGVLVVLANVEVVSVIDGVTAENIQALGILALRIRNNAGTDTVIPGTEVYVNAHNPDPTGTTAMRNIHTDMPLMWVIDVSTLSTANKQMSYIEIVGSTHDGSGAGNAVTLRTRRVTMLKWLFRGASLS